MSKTMLMLVQAQPPLTGRVGAALRRRGYRLDVRNPIDGDPLPDAVEAYAGVVVFGGPMSVNDADTLPGLRRQLEWIPALVERDFRFLGICLGAQLLARSLGAGITPHPQGRAEIGYFPIRPTSAGRELLAGLDHVYQWHVEGFGMPEHAELLAGGDTFANQAYRLGRRVYGIQFHPEVDAQIMESWMEKAAARLSLPGAQAPEIQRQGNRSHDPAIARWLDNFLDHWLE